MDILLITPPLTQLNTPYPATTVLKSFIESHGHKVTQYDLGINLINKVFSPGALAELGIESKYQDTIEAVMNFLQGHDRTLATQIARGNLLPRGPRFNNQTDLEWAFGTSGIEDKAKHFCSLYLEDIADLIRTTIAPHFDLIRYAEQIAIFAPIFDPIQDSLDQDSNLIDTWMLNLLATQIAQSQPQLIGFSVPFPGCLFGALKCAQYIKIHHPNIKIVLGGGYVNTELRNIKDLRIFNYIDFLTLDDGELPLLRLIDYLDHKIGVDALVRSFYVFNNSLQYSGNDHQNIPFAQLPIPNFDSLDMDQYLSLVEITNPMHKLWTDGKWIKLTLAHGCYWAKCAFCDTHLDYISRFQVPKAAQIVDKMDAIMLQTNQSGFHFTDEALPPNLLAQVAHELISRKKVVSYWGNIRFEKAFTANLCHQLAQSGCIAVSGGLEVASDRLLKLMNKGVSIAQATETCYNFSQSGIMVHAYLMYNFPTQTLQETVDALEIVRQLFDLKLIQSAFWHRYAMTIHSPLGCLSTTYGVERLDEQPNSFANNEVPYTDLSDYDVNLVGKALYKACYNYMHGIGLDLPLHQWFDLYVPRTTHKKNKLRNLISNFTSK